MSYSYVLILLYMVYVHLYQVSTTYNTSNESNTQRMPNALTVVTGLIS